LHNENITLCIVEVMKSRC